MPRHLVLPTKLPRKTKKAVWKMFAGIALRPGDKRRWERALSKAVFEDVE